jgi:uncharacterized membrane protein YtjA (UPF0391 family)
MEQHLFNMKRVVLQLDPCKIFKTLKSPVMLRYTITFLIIAVIAAILGFGGIAAGAAGYSKNIFLYFPGTLCRLPAFWKTVQEEICSSARTCIKHDQKFCKVVEVILPLLFY